MREKLEKLLAAYAELSAKMADPAVIADQKEYTRLAKEHRAQTPLADKARAWLATRAEADSAADLVRTESDAGMKELAAEELATLEKRIGELTEEIRFMLVPTDPNDEKDIIVEIRAGAGGDEAALFAGDLYRMYLRFAESHKWKVTEIDSSPADSGGFKEISFRIHGNQVYLVMKFESGVHRVQRVPKTESQGRIHTSTATVAVLPEVGEVEVEINMADLRIDVYRASGPGGQSVNTTDSAVRITHLPTGLTVQSQNQKSQLQNREEALRVLRARLYEAETERQQRERTDERRSQIGSGDRSEKIRTYNASQDRVTDHRIAWSGSYDTVLIGGDIKALTDALISADRAAGLAAAVD
jgi:peptide chain release factor 1